MSGPSCPRCGVLGAPLGIALGRGAWRGFASRLGVVTQPSTPLGWILATAVGAAVVALLDAAAPAHTAARTRPAMALSSE